MEDPGSRSVARVYSQAYLGAAGDANVGAAIEELGSFVHDVLGANPEFDLLPMIYSVSVQEAERRAGHRRVQVTSAAELSPGTLESIRQMMASSLSTQPILEARIDPSLLGGVMIRVGDTVYDGSLKTQVKQLRARLRERCLNEIQRGRNRFSHQDGN